MGKTLGYGEITVANMTEPFTIMLTNEAQQFATDSNRKVTSAQSYYTDIIVIRGSQERTDYTIGNITSSSGITVSKSSKRVTFSVSAGATIRADTGVIEIPITLDGQTVKKQFSWSCGKQGPQGVQGNDGNSFAWNMLSETNCGKKHWGTESSGGKYSVEDFITEDNINAVKLICTEGISTSNWSYVLFKDIKMLKQLKPSTKYTLSYDIKANRSGAISHSICKGDVSNFCTNTVVVNNIIGNETWQHISVVLTTNDLKTTPTNEILYLGRNALSKVGYSIIKNLKLVEGDINTPWSPSQSDIEGKGVVETIQYYLATSQASGVTSSTSGWSTDITTQKLTADKKYLWNCYQTKYSDGTSEPISTPKVIGVYGDKGNGIVASVQRPNKTEFWWSQVGAVGHKDTFDDSSNTRNNCRVGDIFTVMGTSTEGNSHTVYYKSTTDSGDLAGECINHVVAESGADAKNLTITPSSQYFKSTDGGKTFAPNQITIKPTIQGEISFGKWQYSIDGGVSFADVVSGQKGLTISNNVLAVSKDSSLYSDAVTMVTFRAVASDSAFYDTCSIAKIYDVSNIGDGRNLLWNSNFAKTDEAITGTTNSWGLHTRGTNLVASIDTSTKHNGFNTLKTVSAANGDKNSSNDLEWFAWGISERTSDNLHSKNQNYTLSFYAKASVTTDFIVRWGYDAYGADTTRTLTTNWQKYEIKLHQATSAYSITIIFKLLTAGTVWFSEFKLEKGSSATGYSTAPEDLQTAILSTKSEISDVSIKVNNNKQAIEQRVEKTTYEQDLNLVKGNISKANEGLNKWRYEIYPKSLFTSEYQGKSTMDVFAKNTNLTPSQSVLINDTDLSIAWNYDNNYIGYALTFAKFSAAKSVAITFAHDDGAHIYLNGKLIGGSDAYNNKGESLTLGFVKGWNCIEVVVNEGASTEGFKLGTTISAISECQLMNCYYGTPVARQSHITNQLVENTTNIKGISTKVSKVTSVIGDNGENFTSFKNDYSDFKQTMNGFKTTVGQTYVTKDDFNGLEIGGRNLLLYSQTIRAHKDYYDVGWLTDEVETFNGCPVWSVKNQWGRLVCLFKSHVIDRGLVKVGDTLTYSLYAKTNNASGKSINCSYRFKGNTNAYWFNGSAFNVGTSWTRYSVTFTVTKNMLATDTYMTEIGFEETASMSGDDKVYYACPKLERGTKATDYTPAPEDNEINGQNLVSNLPSNWEQGSINYTANLAYGSLKSTLVSRLRTKDVFPVSGNITISAGTSTNSSKEELNFYYVLFDINKKSISHGDTWQSLTSPKIINCGDAKYMAIILRWGSGSTAITPSDISQICLKIERGTSATPFTLAPEDVNGKIVNVETIANQTAKKFEWIVKGGDSSSNFTLTDRVADLVAERINFNGLVKFSGLNTDAKSEIGKVAQSKVDGLEVGGRNLALRSKDFTSGEQYWSINSNFTRSVDSDGFTVLSIKRSGAGLEWNRAIPHNYIPVEEMHRGIIVSFDFMCDKVSELDRGCICALQTYNSGGGRIGWYESQDILSGAQCKLSAPLSDGKWIRVQVPFSEGNLKVTYGNSDAVAYTSVSFNLVANGSIHFKKIKIEYGNKATDWTPAPEDYLPQVDLVSNWTTNTTWIDGGKIYTGSITADKIATDAIKSRNYISSGGTQGSFLNLSDGSFQSPNLSWDANGNLIAKNATLSGEITATKGTIGGWSIISNSFFTKYNSSIDSYGTGISGDNNRYVLWAGEKNNAYGANRNSDTPTDATLRIWRNGAIEVQGNDSTTSGISHLYKILIQAGRIKVGIDDHYIGSIAGSDTILNNQVINQHVSLTAHKGYGWSILHTNDSGNLICDIKRDPNTNGIKFFDDLCVSFGSNQIQLNAGNNGSIELYGGTPFIDFHYGSSTSDYTSRIIANGSNLLSITGNLWVDADIHAGSWLYTSEVHSAGAIVIASDSESYYWAHGFQMARGTSWGGVCIGDDSQGLRLYGTSIWASHSISTSDENLKENFTTLDQYEDFYMNLNPIGFNYIGDYDGKKTHFGFGAHKTEDILESEGYDSDKFAVVTHRPLVQEDIEKRFGKDVEVDIETEYGISYTEFIALNTHMIQKTRRELEQVKQEKTDLEARLQAIEANLGL